MNPELITFGLGIAKDLLDWWRQREANGQGAPTDAEVIARVKAKIAAGDLEGEQFENEAPPEG